MFVKKDRSLLYIVRKCETDIIILIVITVMVSLADNFFPKDQAFPLSVPTLLGTALSLVLAFRTGQAYDRWWEARKIWGAIVNDSRSIVRAVEGFIVDDADPDQAKKFIQSIGIRQIAWVHALGRSLRNQNTISKIEGFITPQEMDVIKNRGNVPNALLEFHSADIKQARKEGLITEFGQLRLDELVMRMVDSMGMCERIKGTVFPSPYNRFVHMTIYIFAVTLTIGIEDFRGLVEIPATVIITTLFLLLERIALLLQDPFENNPSDIPVTTLAHKIEIDLKQMLNRDDFPEPLEDYRYFVM